MYKISKTKAGIKINGILLGNSTINKEVRKTAWKKGSNRPSKIREFEETIYDSVIDIDLNKVKDLIKNEVQNIDKSISDLNTLIENSGPCYYNQSMNHNWGNKAIAGLLNELFNTSLFEY